MNIGSRRSDEVFAERGALAMAGLGARVGGVRAALLVRVADGADRAEPVAVTVAVAVAVAVVLAVKDKGVDVTVLMEVTGNRNVGAPAPAQPVKANTSAVAPARQ